MNLIKFWSKLEARLSDQEGRSRWNNVRIQGITEDHSCMCGKHIKREAGNLSDS